MDPRAVRVATPGAAVEELYAEGGGLVMVGRGIQRRRPAPDFLPAAALAALRVLRRAPARP